MTVLVTGATGALGSLMLQALRERDKLPVIGTARTVGEDSECIQCDLINSNSVYELLSSVRPSIIYHFAGSFSGVFEKDIGANLICTQNILDAIKRLDIETRVVACGSAAEYGLVSAEENPISEDRQLKPVSIYGLTKVMQTMLCEYYVRVHQLDIVVARIFNLNIPNLSEKLFVGRAQSQIKKYLDGNISQLEFGDLDSSRDYVTAQQVMQQILLIAKKGIAGAVYNVGSGIPTKMSDLLKSILEEAGVSSVEIVSNLKHNNYKNTELSIIFANLEKTNALGRL